MLKTKKKTLVIQEFMKKTDVIGLICGFPYNSLIRSTCIFFSPQADDLTPGVVYLGHIPHGFYEDQIRDFFSQFGTVNKVRLSRSKKVGGSHHFQYNSNDGSGRSEGGSEWWKRLPCERGGASFILYHLQMNIGCPSVPFNENGS